MTHSTHVKGREGALYGESASAGYDRGIWKLSLILSCCSHLVGCDGFDKLNQWCFIKDPIKETPFGKEKKKKKGKKKGKNGNPHQNEWTDNSLQSSFGLNKQTEQKQGALNAYLYREENPVGLQYLTVNTEIIKECFNRVHSYTWNVHRCTINECVFREWNCLHKEPLMILILNLCKSCTFK